MKIQFDITTQELKLALDIFREQFSAERLPKDMPVFAPIDERTTITENEYFDNLAKLQKTESKD